MSIEKEDEIGNIELIKSDGKQGLKEKKISFDDLSMEELIEKHKKLIENNNPYSVSKKIDELKISFYKKLHSLKENGEKEEIKEEKLEQENEVKKENDKLHPLEIQFKLVNNRFRKLKAEFRKKRDDEEIKNLSIKKKIIEDIDELSKQEESIKITFDKFRDLQAKWRKTGNVPNYEENDIWQSYHHHVELFYDFIKINKDLRDLDFKRNLEEKTRICEKAENLLSLQSINKMFYMLQELHEHWKNVGPVEREKRDLIWERFQKSTKKINKKKNEYFLRKKKILKNNLKKKTEICNKIDIITSQDISSHSQCQKMIKEIHELNEEWKKAAPIDRKEKKSAWKKYREIINHFNKKKNDFYKNRKNQINNNLQIKIELVKKVERLQNSTDWESTSRQIIKLQTEWKKSPFVPNNLSAEIWKRFKKACDNFFNSRKKYYKLLNKERELNLKKKKEFLKKVKDFKASDNPKKDIVLLNNFTAKWNSLGNVPRDSIKINDEFNAIISSFYKNLKVDDIEKEKIQFQLKIDTLKGNRKSLEDEKKNIRNQMDKIEKSILQYENNISFFGNGKGTEILKKEEEKKIENSKLEIEKLKKKLSLIHKS